MTAAEIDGAKIVIKGARFTSVAMQWPTALAELAIATPVTRPDSRTSRIDANRLPSRLLNHEAWVIPISRQSQ